MLLPSFGVSDVVAGVMTSVCAFALVCNSSDSFGICSPDVAVAAACSAGVLLFALVVAAACSACAVVFAVAVACCPPQVSCSSSGFVLGVSTAGA